MVRKIVNIDENLCNGCGACANACHEGAIAMVDGKAKLIKDDYCDGLGDCLPACPTNAIRIIEREAADYDEAAVKERMEAKKKETHGAHGMMPQGGCPGTRMRQMNRRAAEKADTAAPAGKQQSELRQWPVQIKLVPTRAPYFEGADLLVAADCTAYAYASFHQEFIKDRITLIGCPKLDDCDYAEKLTEIIKNNDIHSIKIVRMEVPCCGGLENAVIRAMQNSGKMIPWQVVVITCDGEATTMP